uniref:Uncharacterized protein n=1 Tax=Manihot esculenta TaxID=3983 RepID=A0A2C9WGU7_MANES
MDQETKHNRKRALDDQDCDSHQSKLARFESVGNSTDLGETHLDSDSSGLNSCKKEILVSVPGPVTHTDTCQPELGYLLEASDDELGLPPTFSGEEKISAVDLAAEASVSGAADFGEILGFEDGIPSYDSCEFGLAGESSGSSYNGSYNDSGDFVTLSGLFDYSSENYAPANDISGGQWQPESLSAL